MRAPRWSPRSHPNPSASPSGVSTDTAKTLLADALDLVHRLPHTWRRIQTLEVPVWRARRIAQKTHALNQKAAAHVDRLLAPRLHTVGVTRIDRAVAHAIAKHMPEEHASREERSRQTWDVTLHHPNPTEYTGTSELHVTGDTLTLTHLYDQICAGAADLKTAGDDDPLGARKAKALGHLTGGPGTPKTKLYLHLDLADLAEPVGSRPGREARTRHHRQDPRLARRHPRHHPTRPPDGPGRCGRPPRPAHLDAGPGHPPRPHLRLPPLPTRHRGCDLDHTIPYDDTGPPGQTRPANLAPLCRRHHRAKTTGRWTYRRRPDGTYAVDRSGRQGSRGSARDTVMPTWRVT